ncbi:unnamed protein product, partial [Brassica oleracea var. botrytis]
MRTLMTQKRVEEIKVYLLRSIDECDDLEVECSSQESSDTEISDDEQSIVQEPLKEDQTERVSFLAALFKKNFSESHDNKNLMLILGDMSGHGEFIFTTHALSCNEGSYHFLIAQPDGFEEQLPPSMQAFMDRLDVSIANSNKRSISRSLQETSQHGTNTITQPANTQVHQSSSTFTEEINETISSIAKVKMSTSGTAQDLII